MISKWRKIRQLSRAELWLLVQSLVLLPLSAAALFVLGFRRWSALLIRANRLLGKPERQLAGDAVAAARAAARMVGIAARYGIWPANCLQRSVTLWWLLLRRGMESELRIGVWKAKDGFQAHAWIECQGHVVNDRAEVSAHFAPFVEPFVESTS